MDKIINFLNLDTVYAHCDVPCGLYSPNAALMAADTVRVMVKQLTDLEASEEFKNDPSSIKFNNSFVRRILVKEQHAELVKKEVEILWSDYFKEEDLDIVPDLHKQVWKVLKLASFNKQNVDLEKSEELYREVLVISDMFSNVVEKRKSK